MRPYPALAAAVATAAASLAAAIPAAAATWTAPATVSAPHTFISGLEAASSGNGTVVADWRFQDGVGNGATTGARGAALAPGAAAFGGERALPGATTQVVPYAQRSVAALLQTSLDSAGRRVRLSVAFGSADGPSLGTARSVAVDDVAFVPRLAVGSDGTGLLAWIARASGARLVSALPDQRAQPPHGLGHWIERSVAAALGGCRSALPSAPAPGLWLFDWRRPRFRRRRGHGGRGRDGNQRLFWPRNWLRECLGSHAGLNGGCGRCVRAPPEQEPAGDDHQRQTDGTRA